MKILSKEHLQRACYEFILQERNDGCWAGGKIPDIFYVIRDTYYPPLKYDAQWLSVIEAVVKMNAVRNIGEQYINENMGGWEECL